MALLASRGLTLRVGAGLFLSAFRIAPCSRQLAAVTQQLFNGGAL